LFLGKLLALLMKTSFNCTFESSVVGMLLHTGLNILVVMHYMSLCIHCFLIVVKF
jgi:hypothetical protein